MLEDLALRYSDLPTGWYFAIGYLFVILGGIIGCLTDRSSREITRAPYFVLGSLTLLFMGAVTLVQMMLMVTSLLYGVFWLIVATELMAKILLGFFIARIAAARSRDVFGHGRMAPLAFVPILNLWLLFARSRHDASVPRPEAPVLMRGFVGVITGLVVAVVASGLARYSEAEALRRVEDASRAGLFNESHLEMIIEEMAKHVSTPMRIDGVTTLVRIEAAGRELRYDYEITEPRDPLTEEMRGRVQDATCSNYETGGIIDAGATVSFHYQRPDGSRIGEIVVDRQVCGR